VDCEKFDRVVLDLLYGELDELTAAAARRHMEHCARCGPIGSGLRATREVGQLPLLAPSADLESRILEAERQAHARLPLRERVGRAVSVMAGYAMRQQLAMAALLVLALASSLLLLRARPGEREAMHVTERGVPEAEGDGVIVPVPASPARGALAAAEPARSAAREKTARGAAERDEAPTAGGASSGKGESGDGAEAYDRAMAEFRSGHYDEAARLFEAVESAGGGNAPSAALFAAQSLKRRSGCSAAAPRFDSVASRYAGTDAANEATWQAAVCYQALGQADRARQGYVALRSAPSHAERAARALDAMDSGGVQAEVASRAPRKAAAAAPAAPPAAAAPGAKPAPPARPPAATDTSSVGF
jgi:TolA-binding protein